MGREPRELLSVKRFVEIRSYNLKPGAVLALIESYTSVVLELDEATVAGLRRALPAMP